MAKTAEKPASRRGRPPKGTEGERRRELLRAAESLFLEQGFGAVSVDEIAKRAGVSKKTIYCLFDTKEDLFAAIMRMHMEESAPTAMPEDARDARDFEAALTAYLTALADAILGPVAVGLFRLSVAEAPRFPALAQAFYREGALRHITQLSGWLERQKKRGLATLDDPGAGATMLTSYTVLEPLRANALGVRDLPDAKEIRRRAATAAKIFTRGCVPERPR